MLSKHWVSVHVCMSVRVCRGIYSETDPAYARLADCRIETTSNNIKVQSSRTYELDEFKLVGNI